MITKSTKDLNHHARLDENDANMHYPKGFLTAIKGKFATKGHDDNLLYLQIPVLPNALNIVSGESNPPTEVDGNIYILQKSAIYLDVDTITWISGNTIEYYFTGAAPNLSAISVGDYLRVRSAGKASNNGDFIITNVNDTTDKILVTNASRSNGTDDEVTPSPATATWAKAAWDGCGDTDHVKYFLGEDKWYGVTPEIGALCYDLTTLKNKIFSSGKWESVRIPPMRKASADVIPSATINTYGAVVNILPTSTWEYLINYYTFIISGGTFGTETLTVRITVTFSDGTILEVLKTFTATGVNTKLSPNELNKDAVYVTQFAYDCKSDIASSTAVATVYFNGYNQ